MRIDFKRRGYIGFFEVMKSIKTCLSIDCPERKSICCGAISQAVSGEEGTGHFECSACGKEYIGGKCTAGEDMTTTLPAKDREEFEKKFPSRRDCSNGQKHLSTCQGCIDIIVEEPEVILSWLSLKRQVWQEEARREIKDLVLAMAKGNDCASCCLEDDIVNALSTTKEDHDKNN